MAGHGGHEDSHGHHEQARCPVCGMGVDPDRAAGTSQYRGRRYYFCSNGCKEKFEAQPEKYVSAG